MLIEILLIALLGSIGALVRYHLGGFVHSSANRALASEADFPFGTLFVNAVGSLVLGLTAGLFSEQTIPQISSVVIGVGFCGSLTTFSTLAVDLQRFVRDRRLLFFALYLSASLVSGISSVLLGCAIARIVS
jgi:CrcB protein